MALRGCISCVIAAVLTIGPSVRLAQAARLAECELVVDGSADPPGDLIVCETSLLKGETNVTAEVRAYVVSQKDGHEVDPIKTTDRTLQDSDGYLAIRVRVEREQGASGAKQSIVVPYAAFDLPDGVYDLGYEVTLRKAGEACWSQPLPLTKVTIGGGQRTEMQPRLLDGRVHRVDEVKRAAIGDSRDQGGVEDRPVRLRTTTPSNPTHGRVSARIERGFERSAIIVRRSDDAQLAGLGGQPWIPATQALSPNERLVRFATNRRVSEAVEIAGPGQFLAERDGMRYGECRLNFPVRYHVRGTLERPSWWERFDPSKHFRVESTQFTPAGEFFDALADDDTLVFVHGFANRFEDGVMTAGQLAADIDFGGRTIAFCWPASGEISQAAYVRDARFAQDSIEDLADFLNVVTAPHSGDSPRRVHVVAHSMGNKVLLGAVYRLIETGRWKEGEKRLGQVVLAAPDVGAATFNNLVDNILGGAERVTYYYYGKDAALGVSQQVNNYEPVGKYPYFERGLDTINVDGSGTDFLGHGYYSSSTKVLADLELLLHHGYGPDRRMPPLGAKTRVYGHEHWSFLPMSATEVGGGG